MKHRRSYRGRGKYVLVGLVVMSATLAQAPSPSGATDQGATEIRSVTASPARDDVHEFCANIADDAKDLRYAKKASELRTLQDEVEARIEVLEEKNREFEAWIERRNEFQRRAQDSLVEIYSKMRPDAAAARLELLGANLAAVILMKLSARQAGVILNEMDAKKAALVTGSSRLPGRGGIRREIGSCADNCTADDVWLQYADLGYWPAA